MTSGRSGGEVEPIRTTRDEDELAAHAVFDLLSDETRCGIVRALAGGDRLRFSTLRERVGTDDSGRFNYHLERLRGRLVHKTPEGYELTPTGRAYADVVDAPNLQ